MRLLAGDIGGTNARLILYQVEDVHQSFADQPFHSTHTVIYQRDYKNKQFSSFQQLLTDFVTQPETLGQPIQTCCLAVAGPVSENRIQFTNRKEWIIDGNEIAEKHGIKSVKLINDFVANGYGLLSLSDEDVVTLQEARHPDLTVYDSPVALIGAGTGLGECFLTPNGQHPCVYGTEGGHVDFAPRTVLEQRLLAYIQDRLMEEEEGGRGGKEESGLIPRVSIERVVSGMGLENIYEFLRENHAEEVDHALDAEYEASLEKGRLIGERRNEYGLFERAMRIMFAVYGGEVGNVALKFLPYGGIYIAGGIAPKNIEMMSDGSSEFMERFWNKGRVSGLMKEFAVHVVLEEKLGQRGALIVAAQLAARLPM